MATYLVIHGHFYQPPRENPWTEVVEPEPSAAPFHDWNERIHKECYRANAYARIVGPEGLITGIQNNYLKLNFNFGPTLLSWMERQYPQDYRRIIEADKESAALHGGHGNAIAQAYNHCILPLCNEEDLKTQIRWGLREFRHRFGREPESMWMPETAANRQVLAAMIDEGLQYAILSPHQAKLVREPGGQWQEVGEGNVDPGRAYLFKHPDGSGRSMALFFYDGPISKALAFEKALDSSQALIDVFKRGQMGEGRLVHAATDGESYGHHSAWGERALAYAQRVNAAQSGFEITNYGHFLEKYPAQWEADIKEGPQGEGTAWSCAHGVGRWIRDCGCSTGGGEGWNQAWRMPLRQALDTLRDLAKDIFLKAAQPLFKDPWAARNDFIDVVLDPSLATRERFLKKHAAENLDEDTQIRALSLMEMQRQAMLMYTSCGWFFNDLAGIETVQILKYACRVIDVIEEMGYASPRGEFLGVLKKAQSNDPAFGDGERLFREQVEPSRVTPERLAAHLAISSIAEAANAEGRFGSHDYQVENVRVEKRGKITVGLGRVSLQAVLTGRRHRFAYAAYHFGGIDFFCAARNDPGDAAFEDASAKVWDAFQIGLFPGMLKTAREEFGPREYGLDDLLPDGRRRVSSMVFGDLVRSLADQYSGIYEENRRLLEMFESKGIELPTELKTATEYTLGRRFEQEIKTQKGSLEIEDYQVAQAIAEQVKRRGFRIDRGESNKIFTGMVTQAVRQALNDPDAAALQRAVAIIRLAERLDLKPDLERAQEYAAQAGDMLHEPGALKELADLLGLDPVLLEPAAAETALASEPETSQEISHG